MNYKIATTLFVIGSVLAPVAAYAADSESGHSSAVVYVKDSAITTRIKAQLAADHLGSMKYITVDTGNDGGVWMTGTANSQEEVDRAVEIARNTEGVTSVHSDLKVQKDR